MSSASDDTNNDDDDDLIQDCGGENRIDAVEEEEEDRRVQHNMQVTIVYLIRFSSLTIIRTGDAGASGGGGLTDDAGISIRYAQPITPSRSVKSLDGEMGYVKRASTGREVLYPSVHGPLVVSHLRCGVLGLCPVPQQNDK